MTCSPVKMRFLDLGEEKDMRGLFTFFSKGIQMKQKVEKESSQKSCDVFKN